MNHNVPTKKRPSQIKTEEQVRKYRLYQQSKAKYVYTLNMKVYQEVLKTTQERKFVSDIIDLTSSNYLNYDTHSHSHCHSLPQLESKKKSNENQVININSFRSKDCSINDPQFLNFKYSVVEETARQLNKCITQPIITTDYDSLPYITPSL